MNTVAQTQTMSPSPAPESSDPVGLARTHLGTLRTIVAAFNAELRGRFSPASSELFRLVGEVEKGLEVAERDLTKLWWGQGPRLPVGYGETEDLLREELSALRSCVKRAAALAGPEKHAQAGALRREADAHFADASLHLDDLLHDGEADASSALNLIEAAQAEHGLIAAALDAGDLEKARYNLEVAGDVLDGAARALGDDKGRIVVGDAE